MSALSDLAFFSYRLANPLELPGGFPIEIDDVVQGVGNLSCDPHLRHRHFDGEVALADGGEDGKQLIYVQSVGRGNRNTSLCPTLGLTAIAGRATIAGRFSRHENSRGATRSEKRGSVNLAR